MSIPVIYANTQYIAGKHLFKTIPEGISTTLNSLTNVPTCNVMTLVGANVGIGTTNPTASLHVLPNSTATGVIINQVGSGSILDIQYGGISKVTINGNGNVGIGTTIPNYILHIQGDSLLNGTIITNNNNINAGTGTITASTFSGTATKVSQDLIRGTYLTGTNYNGAVTTTWAVDATSANTANKVVVRDASGNFSAGTITATFSGTATQVSQTLTRGTYLTGSSYNGAVATTWAVDATSANTASKVVARDASGNFSAGTITATDINITSDATIGGITNVNEVQADDGSITDPSFTFTTDSDTGMYRQGTNSLGFTAGGVERARLSSSGFTVTGNVTCNFLYGLVEGLNDVTSGDIGSLALLVTEATTEASPYGSYAGSGLCQVRLFVSGRTAVVTNTIYQETLALGRTVSNPSGTWRALSGLGSGDTNRVGIGLFLRIS